MRPRDYLLPHILSFIAIISAWYVLSFLSVSAVVPPPHRVILVLLENVLSGEALFHSVMTLQRVATSLLLAIGYGLLVGLLMGRRRFFEEYFICIVILSMSIPSVVWTFLGIFWFGAVPFVPVFSAFLIVYPYVAINVWQGVKSIDGDLVKMSIAFNVSRRRIIRHVFIPSILPFLFSALRYGFVLSWHIVIIAEAFSTPNGIGEQIYYWYGLFGFRQVMAWGVLFVMLTLAIEQLLKIIERRVFRWRGEVSL